MTRVKSVAIVGAGPSGLAAAKSLLHDHRHGTFRPIIFEKQPSLGGIWPISNEDQSRTVAPDMRTNASKHIVSFSDLAWNSVELHQDRQPSQDVATFPEAHEVGKYLQTYADRYIPKDSIRYSREVVSICRRETPGPEWEVTSRHPNVATGQSIEHFDHVVIASGFFASPDMSQVDGLQDFEGKVIHSSQLRDIENTFSNLSKGSKIVVLGGSMSGGDAAASLALQLSSLRVNAGKRLSEHTRFSVHHVTPRPFWSVPTFVPLDPTKEDKINPHPTFLPLDLILAELKNRPEDQIRFTPLFTFGPEAARQFNAVFHSMIGNDQSSLAGGALTMSEDHWDKPMWLILSDCYSEFARSGDIQVTGGRVYGVKGHEVLIRGENNKISSLDDVAMLVLGTGFTPHAALSFLSPEIKDKLSYDEGNHYNPLQLFNYATFNPALPTLGFVGFYRGPYFGVLEQQARILGALWTGSLDGSANEPPGTVDSIEKRGQFPMGDYVGLMESISTLLGSERLPLSPEHLSRTGPAIPARYKNSAVVKGPEAALEQSAICKSALYAVSNPSLFVAPAIFRALQGKWKLTREISSRIPTYPTGTFSGKASLTPRLPTAKGYSAEHFYHETGELVTQEGLRMTGSRSYVYRLSELEPQKISAWFVKPESGSTMVDYHFHDIEVTEAAEAETRDESKWGTGWHAKGSHHLCVEDHYDTNYFFEFRAIDIKKWGIGYVVKGPNKDYSTRATYVR